jgi:hypothetical protein
MLEHLWRILRTMEFENASRIGQRLLFDGQRPVGQRLVTTAGCERIGHVAPVPCAMAGSWRLRVFERPHTRPRLPELRSGAAPRAPQ